MTKAGQNRFNHAIVEGRGRVVVEINGGHAIEIKKVSEELISSLA